jgi:hypothetical protein
VRPDCLTSLTLTCRFIRDNLEPRLKQHRRLKAEYRSVVLHNPREHPLGLVNKIISNPWIAYYVAAISFTGNGSRLSDYIFDPPDDQARNLLSAMKADSRFYQIQRCLVKYLQDDCQTTPNRLCRVCRGEDNVTFGVLLLMLKSLKKLRLDGQAFPETMYKNIADLALTSTKLLENLEVVECASPTLNFSRVFFPFMGLPSVKVVRVYRMVDEYDYEWSTCRRNRASGIEIFELTYISLSPETLFTLLEPMQVLRVFKYHFFSLPVIHNSPLASDKATASQILHMLAILNVNTLTTLSLTACHRGKYQDALHCLKAMKVRYSCLCLEYTR